MNFQLNDLIQKIKDLYSKYDIKEKVGICFKLQIEKNPLDIIGVLDFLKYKLKIWGNSNIFCYQGKLFYDNYILVVGSNYIEEAKDIVLFIFLKEVLEKEVFSILDDFDYENDLEEYLNKKISEGLVKGYPNDIKLEKKITDHIIELLKD
ncbi:MAG: hypothetical protein ACFFBH_09460 [Promethearchaeota archaeon]